MGSQVYEFSVQMACDGCATSVTNVLVKTAGVHDVQIDLEGKKVFVTSICPSVEVLEAIKKTGMTCEFIGVKT